MQELGFFKHDIRSRSSRKMMRFLKRNGYDLYSLFWMIVEEIYLSPTFRLSIKTNDLAEWADLFFCPVEKLQHCIAEAVECRLWYIDEHGLGSYRVDEELKSISDKRRIISEKRREAVEKRWAKNTEKSSPDLPKNTKNVPPEETPSSYAKSSECYAKSSECRLSDPVLVHTKQNRSLVFDQQCQEVTEKTDTNAYKAIQTAQRKRKRKRESKSRIRINSPGGEDIFLQTFKLADVKFPEHFTLEKCQPAIAEWLDYKKARRESYKSVASVNRLLQHWAKFPEQDFLEAIDRSIRNNWAGLHENKPTQIFSHQNGSKPYTPKSVTERNLEKGLAVLDEILAEEKIKNAN